MQSASARGVVTTPSGRRATMRECLRSRLVEGSAMIERPSAARLRHAQNPSGRSQADVTALCRLGVDLACQVDLERRVDREKTGENAEHQRIVGIARRADADQWVASA